jgi:hypothetical protein
MTEIEQDSFAVLSALVAKQNEADALDVDQIDDYLSAVDLGQATEIPPKRLNRAIEYMEGPGYVDVVRTFGTSPYDFLQARVTAFGRQAYQETLSTSVDTSPTKENVQESSESQKVFVVHGRDEASREKVARFLERLEVDAIILSEKPNEGRTLIEKFEANALGVRFAVVIMTPDDTGFGGTTRKCQRGRTAHVRT